jgi:predicted DNA-binding protein
MIAENVRRIVIGSEPYHDYIRIIRNIIYSGGVLIMSKTVTLRLDDDSYNIIKNHALADNRPLSNYIETATLKYIEEVDYVDDFEMENILNDEELIESLKKGSSDAAERKGRFI